MRFLWMSLECFRVFFAFICFCLMIESAAFENVVVVAMKKSSNQSHRNYLEILLMVLLSILVLTWEVILFL